MCNHIYIYILLYIYIYCISVYIYIVYLYIYKDSTPSFSETSKTQFVNQIRISNNNFRLPGERGPDRLKPLPNQRSQPAPHTSCILCQTKVAGSGIFGSFTKITPLSQSPLGLIPSIHNKKKQQEFGSSPRPPNLLKEKAQAFVTSIWTKPS